MLKLFKYLFSEKSKHFLSVNYTHYRYLGFIIKIIVRFNKNYVPCVIYRKKFKNLRNFVVVGLRYNGKNVNRRTTGYAKKFIKENDDATCIYCKVKLDEENATVDHIVPISKGGNNTQVNMLVCCKDCNHERGNDNFNNFLKYKGISKRRFL